MIASVSSKTTPIPPSVSPESEGKENILIEKKNRPIYIFKKYISYLLLLKIEIIPGTFLSSHDIMEIIIGYGFLTL